MTKSHYDTLSLAINSLTQKGFVESFRTEHGKLIATGCKKEYSPEDLKIVDSFRFEGMTDPQDDSMLFAIEANDGLKGTLVISYSSEHSHNADLIKNIPKMD